MAKDFGKLNNKKIEAVAKKSNESANVIVVKMIGNDNLLDYPKNNEDLTMTEDLELSMKQNGFTDPIEVTSYGCENGKYMIVSGHRRRTAGVKVGITTFPCIVKNFSNDNDVFNYVLLANSQRDSAKDPLLYCKRYKMHEECLKESGFNGNIRAEIATRLGLSVQQADRYNQMNKVILPVWDMVRDEVVGMSSVLPMSKYSEEEQEEILKMFNSAIESGLRLSRELCKTIIDNYKAGIREFGENNSIEEEHNKTDFVKDVKENNLEVDESSILDRNNEMNYDTSHREGVYDNTESYKDERLTKEEYEVIESSNENEVVSKSESDRKKDRKNTISNTLERLERMLSLDYECDDEKDALELMKKMKDVVDKVAGSIFFVSLQYEDELKNDRKKLIEDIIEGVECYKY